MNCPDCFRDVRSRNDLLNQAMIDAKKYAVENHVTVFIYEEAPNIFKFISEEAATAAGIYPMRIISHLQPASNG